MMKSIPSLFAILISLLVLFIQTNASVEYAESSGKGVRPNWLTDSHRNRVELFKKWLGNKPIENSVDGRSSPSPYDMLHPTQAFKGACYCRLFSLGIVFHFPHKQKCRKELVKLSLENKSHTY